MSVYINKTDELTHWGIKGMKWGVRRYQNADGSLTPAGQKRYAQTIKKQVEGSLKKTKKDFRYPVSNYDRMRKIEDDMVKDFNTNFKNQLQPALKNIKEKRLEYAKLIKEANYYDSEECLKDSAKAYKQTMDWFKKNDPEYLNTIIKNNGGRTDDLDGFHDFRKTYEGYEDLAWQKGEAAFNKKNAAKIAAADKARDDYIGEVRKVTTSIIGKYGDVQVNRGGAPRNVSRIIDNIIMKMDREQP